MGLTGVVALVSRLAGSGLVGSPGLGLLALKALNSASSINPSLLVSTRSKSALDANDPSSLLNLPSPFLSTESSTISKLSLFGGLLKGLASSTLVMVRVSFLPLAFIKDKASPLAGSAFGKVRYALISSDTFPGLPDGAVITRVSSSTVYVPGGPSGTPFPFTIIAPVCTIPSAPNCKKSSGILKSFGARGSLGGRK